MRIAIDQDQVLAKWVEKVLKWYNEDYKTNFTVNDVTNYFAMENILGPQGKQFIRSCIRYQDFYHDLEPVEGAIEGVKQLIDQGHDVLIVSAVPKCGAISYHGKLAWLRTYMPYFKLDNFIATTRKGVVDADMLLDDAGHNVDAWKKSGRNKLGVLFDRPWNQDLSPSSFDKRVVTWPEFVAYVEQVQAEKDLRRMRGEHGVYG